MTIIQPGRSQALAVNKFLVLLIVMLLIAAVWLVSLYNQLVNLNHNILDAESRIQKVETANAELKDKTFNLFDNQKLEALAAERQLIKDKEPQYLEAEAPIKLAAAGGND